MSVLLVLLFTASTSFAAGFRLPEAGAKAMGMGFAFTAQADDPSAIYFNPAGLTQLKGNNIMVGVTYVRVNGGEFTGTTPLTGGATASETQKSARLLHPECVLHEDHLRRVYRLRRRDLRAVRAGAGVRKQEHQHLPEPDHEDRPPDGRRQPDDRVQDQRVPFRRRRGSTGCTGRRSWRRRPWSSVGISSNANVSILTGGGRGRVGVQLRAAPEAHGKLPDRRQLPQPVHPQDQGRGCDHLEHQPGVRIRRLAGSRPVRKGARPSRCPPPSPSAPRTRWAS